MKINIWVLFFTLCVYMTGSSYASDLDPFVFSGDQPLLQLAEVKFSEKAPHAPKATKKRHAKSRPLVLQPRTIEQYEIEGYIDQEYIRAVLEVENKQSVVGNIYDDKGNSTYVHGEYIDGTLQVYDTAGAQITIILNE